MYTLSSWFDLFRTYYLSNLYNLSQNIALFLEQSPINLNNSCSLENLYRNLANITYLKMHNVWINHIREAIQILTCPDRWVTKSLHT